MNTKIIIFNILKDLFILLFIHFKETKTASQLLVSPSYTSAVSGMGQRNFSTSIFIFYALLIFVVVVVVPIQFIDLTLLLYRFLFLIFVDLLVYYLLVAYSFMWLFICSFIFDYTLV